MPVISTRRYSSSYLTPSSTTTSSVSSYRSNYSSTSNTSSSKDLPPTSSRYNFGDSTYRSTYRPSLTTSGISSTSGTTGSYRSRYDFDDADKKKYSSSSTAGSSLSTRIGVSKTSSSNSRFNSDTLPPLPPSSSNAHTHGHSKRSLSRSRDQNDSGESNGVGSSKNGDRSVTNGKLSLMNDLDFYEKYSPSRYMTKYELSRSRSLSEAAQTPTRDKSPSSSNSVNYDTPTHTPKCEVCRTTHQHYLLSLSPSSFYFFSLSLSPLCRVIFHVAFCVNIKQTFISINNSANFTDINKAFFSSSSFSCNNKKKSFFLNFVLRDKFSRLQLSSESSSSSFLLLIVDRLFESRQSFESDFGCLKFVKFS